MADAAEHRVGDRRVVLEQAAARLGQPVALGRPDRQPQQELRQRLADPPRTWTATHGLMIWSRAGPAAASGSPRCRGGPTGRCGRRRARCRWRCPSRCSPSRRRARSGRGTRRPPRSRARAAGARRTRPDKAGPATSPPRCGRSRRPACRSAPAAPRSSSSSQCPPARRTLRSSAGSKRNRATIRHSNDLPVGGMPRSSPSCVPFRVNSAATPSSMWCSSSDLVALVGERGARRRRSSRGPPPRRRRRRPSG